MGGHLSGISESEFYPKVSIVIPVYNGSNFLREALDSALSQTYANVEVLVVNDGSNDGGETERIAVSYGERIRYLRKENGGVASALNLGIENMSGEYFSWLSHDDVYYPYKLLAQIAHLRKLGNKKVILYCNYDIINEHSRVIGRYTSESYRPDEFIYRVLSNSFLHGCTALIPKEAFNEVGLFNTALKTTQDYHLWVRMAKRFGFIHMPEVLIQSREHAEQGSACTNHLKDLDDFYIWCLKEVPSISIEELYGIRSSRFYRGLALGYRKRKLDGAYKSAIAVGRGYARKEGLLSFAIYELLTSSGVEALMCAYRKIEDHMGAQYKALKTVRSVKKRFTKVYDKNIWGNRESRSGEGGSLAQTAIIREEIPKLVTEFNVKRFMDAPCGDYNWMKEVALEVHSYIGVDIVDDLIGGNNRRYGNSARQFICRDLISDELPQADLILCRDCLVHLSFEEALSVLKNYKRSGAKYLLTTTFCDRTLNENHSASKNGFLWRPINLTLPPFNFPPPLRLINEQCTECNGIFADKCLGLWRFEDLKC